jgi:hypothetical protein
MVRDGPASRFADHAAHLPDSLPSQHLPRRGSYATTFTGAASEAADVSLTPELSPRLPARVVRHARNLPYAAQRTDPLLAARTTLEGVARTYDARPTTSRPHGAKVTSKTRTTPPVPRRC